MSFFSWLYMISSILTYLAAVGWYKLAQDVALFEGEDYDDSITKTWLVGPFMLLRDLIAGFVMFNYHGILLLASEEARMKMLDENVEEE